MSREEQYALEHHVNTCILCSEAVDGVLDGKFAALETIGSLDNTFLKDHFNLLTPQIHLNSMAPAASTVTVRRTRRKTKMPPVFKTSNVAAAVLLAIAVMWYFDFSKEKTAADTNTHQPGTRKNKVVNPAAITTGPTKGVQAITPPESQEPTQLVLTEPERQKEAGRKDLLQPSLEQNLPGNKKPAGQLETVQESSPVRPTVSDILAEERKESKNAGATSTAVTASEDEEQAPPEAQASASDHYAAGNYAEALSIYRKEMNSPDRSSRQEATMMAAKCYLNLGQNTKAHSLLESLAEEGNGAQRRQAKRMLRDLNKDSAQNSFTEAADD
jgi:FimV-like protein